MHNSMGFHEMGLAWQSSLMKNSADDNAVSIRFIEDDVLTAFEAPEARIELIALTSNAGLLPDEVKGVQEEPQISLCLVIAPSVGRIQKNFFEVGVGLPGEFVCSQAVRASRI